MYQEDYNVVFWSLPLWKSYGFMRKSSHVNSLSISLLFYKMGIEVMPSF